MSTLEALRMNIRAMRCAGNHPFVRRGRGGIYQNNVMITVQVTISMVRYVSILQSVTGYRNDSIS